MKILTNFVNDYGNEGNYLDSEGKILNREETEKYYLDYLQDLDVLDQIYINFGEHFVAPTSITHGNTGRSRVNVALPI